MKKAALATVVVFSMARVVGEVSLPAVISDNMVIQRQQPVPVWGWASPGETVTVRLGGRSASAETGRSGRWKVRLDPLHASPIPLEMIVEGSNRLVVRDVLVGEVWLASGQSNMQFSLSGTDTAASEIARADYPDLRVFLVPRRSTLEAQEDTEGRWQKCSPQSAAGFSAVAYFFGRELHRTLRVPVGLVAASWGGTSAEEWTSAEALQGEEEFAPILGRWDRARPRLAGLFEKPYPFELDLDDIRFVGDDGDVLRLDDFEDADLATGLFGEWASGADPEALQVLEGSGGRFLRFSGGSTVGGSAALRVRFGPGRAIDLSGYQGLRFLVRGRGFLKYQSLQPTITDSDNYTPGLVELGPEWREVSIQFADLRQAGWGKQLPFTLEALSGALWEILPTDGPLSRPPSGLYNGMIHPLVPFALRGVIWYQGEGNASRGHQYRKLLPALVGSWRRAWEQGDFPFLVVQLPNHRKRRPEPSRSDWAELREAQWLTSRSVPGVGIAVTIDLGEADDVHPRSKVGVGNRLAALALGRVYGVRDVYSGPEFQETVAEGSRLRVRFAQIGSGLVVAGGPPLRGFAVAGADRRFVWAEARIDGDSVVVWSDQVDRPLAVRYAWADNPAANLYNREGFPAVPFRSDGWPGVTDGRR